MINPNDPNLFGSLSLAAPGFVCQGRECKWDADYVLLKILLSEIKAIGDKFPLIRVAGLISVALNTLSWRQSTGLYWKIGVGPMVRDR